MESWRDRGKHRYSGFNCADKGGRKAAAAGFERSELAKQDQIATRSDVLPNRLAGRNRSGPLQVTDFRSRAQILKNRIAALIRDASESPRATGTIGQTVALLDNTCNAREWLPATDERTEYVLHGGARHSPHSGDSLFRTFHNATSRDESYSVHSRRMLKHVAYMYNELSPSRLQEASEHGGSGDSSFARQCFVSRFVFVFTIGGVSNVLLPTLRPPVSCTP